MTSARIKKLLILNIGKLKRIQTLNPSNSVTITVRVALLVFSAFLVILIDLTLASCESNEDEHSCLSEIEIYNPNDACFEDGSKLPMYYVHADYQGNSNVTIPADQDGIITLGCSSNKPVSWEFQGYQHEEDLESVVKRVTIKQTLEYPTTDDENENDQNKLAFCYFAEIDIVSSPIFGGNEYTCTHMSDPLSATRKSLYFYGSDNAQVQFIKPSGSTILQVESVSPDEVIIPCRGNHPNIYYDYDAVKLTKEISPGEYQKLNKTFKISYNPKKGFTITPRNLTSDSNDVITESLYGRYKCSGLENGTVEAVFSKTDPSKVKNVQERSTELTVGLEYDENGKVQWFVCSLNSSNSSSTSELNPANFSMHYVPCKNPVHCQLILKYLHNLSVDSPKLSERKVSTFYDSHLRKLKWNARVPVPDGAGSPLPAAGVIICRTQNKLKYQYAQFFKTVTPVDKNLPEHLMYEDQNSMQLSQINLRPQYASEKSSDIDPSSLIQISFHAVIKTGQNSELNLAEVTMNVSCTVSSFMFTKESVQILVQHLNGENSAAKIKYFNSKYYTDATLEVIFLIEDKPQDISSIICRVPTWNSGEWVSHSIPTDFKKEMSKYFSNMMTASAEETLPFYNTYASGIAVMEINMKSLNSLEPSPITYSQELLEGVTMKISCELSSFIFVQGSQQLYFEYSNSTIETPAEIMYNYTLDSRIVAFTNDKIFLVSNSRENISSIICRASAQISGEIIELKYNVGLPIIISASESTVVVHDTHSNFRIFCEVGGIPSGKVAWYHNEKIYEGLPGNSKGFHNKSKDTAKHELHFNQTTVNFSSMKGIYTCNATNFIGTTLHDVYIDVINVIENSNGSQYNITTAVPKSLWESQLMYSLIAVGILSSSVIVALLLWLYVYKKSIKALKDDFIEFGKDYYDGFKRHFADDDDNTRARLITSVRTNVGFVRALQKHYNQSKLTIKEKHLIKYNQTPIKSGNFGKIYRAKLIKGKWKKKVTEVVVKESINRKPGDAIDLLAEFKTLVYVGELGHSNVVRLLGAVVNFRKRNFQIVLEWCENGSLKDFLEENKNNYSETRRDFVSLSHALHIPDSDSSSTNSTEGSNASNTITREDLIRWSYELACGMAHLASLQLVHADLAIRNLLLTKERVLKITDFGFSKMLRQYDEFYTPGPNSTHHQKQFPWRSLAVECTNATMLSTKSDVWAYGVTLWEIFSLGQVPYASTASHAAVERALRRGVRLMRPTHATDRIYKVMRLCWCHNPRDRPEFSSLVATFKDILSDGVIEEENPRLVAGEPQQQQQQPPPQQELGPSPPEQDCVRYVKLSILSGDGDGGGGHNNENPDVDGASPGELALGIGDYVI